MKKILLPILFLAVLPTCQTSDTENRGIEVGNPQISGMTLRAIGDENDDCKVTDVSADGFATTVDSNSFGLSLTLSEPVKTEIDDNNIVDNGLEDAAIEVTLDDTALADVSSTAFSGVSESLESTDTLNVVVAKENTFVASTDYELTIAENSITCDNDTQNTAAYVVSFALEENADAVAEACAGEDCATQIELDSPFQSDGVENPFCKISDLALISLYNDTGSNDIDAAFTTAEASVAASPVDFANFLFSFDWQDAGSAINQQVVGFDAAQFSLVDENGFAVDIQYYLTNPGTPDANFVAQGLSSPEGNYSLTLAPGAISCAAGSTTATYTTLFTITP